MWYCDFCYSLYSEKTQLLKKYHFSENYTKRVKFVVEFYPFVIFEKESQR